MSSSPNQTYDVVVIGGGVIGCSIAYYLQRGGLMVAMVEKGTICSGASGSNQGGATFSRTLQPFTELAKASQTLFESLKDEFEFDIDLEEVNYLLCATDVNEEKEKLLMQTHRELLQVGTECRFITGKQLKDLEVPLGKAVEAAIYIKNGIFMVWPFKLVYAFLLSAKRFGAKVFTNTEVVNLSVRKGAIQSVVTNRGEMKSKYVVNAAGCWSGRIGEMAGVHIPVKPKKGQVVVTEPTEIYKYRYIMDVDYLTVERDQKKQVEIAASLMQHKHGNWTIGSSRELVGFNTATSYEGIRLLINNAVRFLPGLGDLYLIRSYSGLRPFCYADGNPILGEVEKVKGFVVATGHDGSGIKFSAITGKLIAEEIITGKPSPLLDNFRYSRFHA